jgi:hypothetical protein
VARLVRGRAHRQGRRRRRARRRLERGLADDVKLLALTLDDRAVILVFLKW